MKRRTEITVETDEIIIIRRPGRALRTWCKECDRQVMMVTVDQAAAIIGRSSRAIFRMAEDGSIHSAETPEGFLLICLQSLTPVGRDDVNGPGAGGAKKLLRAAEQ